MKILKIDFKLNGTQKDDLTLFPKKQKALRSKFEKLDATLEAANSLPKETQEIIKMLS